MIPRSWIENATPPTCTGRVENGLGNSFTSLPQIDAARPFRITSRPSVTITTVSCGACSTGRITTRSIATPPANAISSVSTNAGQ